MKESALLVIDITIFKKKKKIIYDNIYMLNKKLIVLILILILILKSFIKKDNKRVLKAENIPFKTCIKCEPLTNVFGYVSKKASQQWFGDSHKKAYGSLTNSIYKGSLIVDVTMNPYTDINNKKVAQFGIGFDSDIKEIKRIKITEIKTGENFILYTKDANTGDCTPFTEITTSYHWCSETLPFFFKDGDKYLLEIE